MAKKKYEESNATIGEIIYNEYVADLKNNSVIDVEKEIPLLVNNNLAVTLKDAMYLDSSYPGIARVGSKFVQKFNKDLKASRCQLMDYEYGGEMSKMAEDNPELISLAKKRLEPGRYYVQLDDENYCALVMSEGDGELWKIDSSISFIGNDCRYWRDRFSKMWDKYKNLIKAKKRECICDIDTCKPQKTVFKPFEQLIFKDKEKVLKYIDNWLKNVPVYYKKYNMIAKLSIMLYGDPGTGKSTFSGALARYLGMGTVMTVKPGHFVGNDNNDRRSQSHMYDEGVVISLDDIDCYCQSREDTQDKENSEALANLLSFLDNPPTTYIKASDGVRYPVAIIVASTNYFDRLDDAVKRYGRFDLKIHMPLFTRVEAQEMCDLYGLQLDDIVTDSRRKNFEISPSYLQALCLENLDKSMKENG